MKSVTRAAVLSFQEERANTPHAPKTMNAQAGRFVYKVGAIPIAETMPIVDVVKSVTDMSVELHAPAPAVPANPVNIVSCKRVATATVSQKFLYRRVARPHKAKGHLRSVKLR